MSNWAGHSPSHQARNPESRLADYPASYRAGNSPENPARYWKDCRDGNSAGYSADCPDNRPASNLESNLPSNRADDSPGYSASYSVDSLPDCLRSCAPYPGQGPCPDICPSLVPLPPTRAASGSPRFLRARGASEIPPFRAPREKASACGAGLGRAPETEIEPTTEATENAEKVRPAFRRRTICCLCVLCGSISDSGWAFRLA